MRNRSSLREMRENHTLPHWLTGRSEEDERAHQLLQASPAQANDDLAWLDEFLTAPPDADEGSAPPLLSSQNRPPRVTRVSSSAPTPSAPPTPATVSARPPAPSAASHPPARFSFRNQPAWWQTLDERKHRSHAKHPRGEPQRGVLPAWMRE
ncbi:MAG: hypothetical protein OXF22_08725 [Anaerolineaceae bacterium]|nr:hypothetical protein [Anaerolineaceae bacterium]